ncbi:fibronectin type III domain-containing protein [Streptomyces sp. NPDC006435]|uniref:fibronectin type III domain-containing protein n=1 Tax=Streptomyces sp. NPDC006435 TaxID=3154300 RepID=UPI0033B397FE
MKRMKQRIAALGASIAMAGVGLAATAPRASADPPTPPDPVSVSVLPGIGVKITWPHSDAELLHNYAVGDGSTSEFVPANTNTYVWGDISPGEHKCFQVEVQTESEYGASGWSAPECITMPK